MHLFGNSLGGAVATRVAAVRPDLVRTLTLVSPALPEIRVQRTRRADRAARGAGRRRALHPAHPGLDGGARVRGVLALCYGDPGRVDAGRFRNAVAGDGAAARLPYFWDAMMRSARGIVNAYTLGGQHGLWRQAERVLAPTLLVYGGRDQLVSVTAWPAGRPAAFRDSRLLTLPDAGHVAMMEYPEPVGQGLP